MKTPHPNPPVAPNGSVTFPRSESGEVQRDHVFLMCQRPALCPGTVPPEPDCVMNPGQVIMGYLAQPEMRMVVGCWEHVFAFAAARGVVKRLRAQGMLEASKPVLYGPTGERAN